MQGIDGLSGAQSDSVYFGAYQQASYDVKDTSTIPAADGVATDKDGTKYYHAETVGQGDCKNFSIDPIKWRVLSTTGDGLFLFSDQNLDVVQYHEDYEDITWERSTIRSWLNGYGASENDGGDAGKDFSSDNFISSAFSNGEQTAILDTAVKNEDNTSVTPAIDGGNDTSDKIYLLSLSEIQSTDYGFTNNDSRIGTNTAYVYAGGRNKSSYMNNAGGGIIIGFARPAGTRNVPRGWTIPARSTTTVSTSTTTTAPFVPL